VYELLAEQEIVDWATTALFYTAVHLSEGWLLSMVGTSSGSHESRARHMNRLGVPRRVFLAYEELRKASELARYRDWSPVLNTDRLARLHDGAYRLVCEQFEAPDTIVPR
jgi:hypothetical protein